MIFFFYLIWALITFAAAYLGASKAIRDVNKNNGSGDSEVMKGMMKIRRVNGSTSWATTDEAGDLIEELDRANEEVNAQCMKEAARADTLAARLADAEAKFLALDKDFDERTEDLIAAQLRLAEAERLLRLWQDDPYKAAWPTIEFLRPAVSATVEHTSDCAIHNEPAYPAGPCDCGAAVTVSAGEVTK